MCQILVDRFRGYEVLTLPTLPFPIDLLRRPYDSVALPCETVMIEIYTRSPIILFCLYKLFNKYYANNTL